MPGTIRFISDRDAYGWMSNFQHAPFTFVGQLWPTVEHAFQAAKNHFIDPACTQIREAKSPGEAKRIGRTVKLRADWEEVKLDFMSMMVIAKFCTYPQMALRLVDTGDMFIEEDSKWDRFWGTGKLGPGGTGKNHMGRILMETRKILKRDFDLHEVIRKQAIKLV